MWIPDSEVEEDEEDAENIPKKRKAKDLEEDSEPEQLEGFDEDEMVIRRLFEMK